MNQKEGVIPPGIRKMPEIKPEWTSSFWSQVDLSKGLSACCIWLGYTDRDGYGVVGLCGIKQKFRVNRIAYYLFYEIDPAGFQVMHSCDNRLCCNPAHLSLGTHQDNMRDRELKKRCPQGEVHYGAKLDNKKASDIRSMWLSGSFTQPELAEKYHVSTHTIHKVIKNKTWIHGSE